MLHNGLYEQIINKGLDAELSVTDKLSQTAPIDSAEASKVLSKYVAEIVEKGLNNVKDNGGNLTSQVELVNRIVSTIMTETKEADFDTLSVAERAEQLLALFDKKNNVPALDERAEIIRPETSIAQSSLFTGAVHEPQMFTELKKEIVSADRIDMLVSFIKWSGLRLIMDELREFTHSGGELRIITTSYMGATDVKAVEELRKLPNTHIKVSYNTKTTRLHAKAYIFYRETGFTTAYVGSSNLSNAALTSGLEWNTKVTKRDLPETIDKIAATFEYYWNDREFEYYAEDQKERLARALKAEKYFDTNNADVYTMDINPYSYQQEILDKLEAERTVRGYTRNLVVAATGTGKTVISALDYKRFRKQNPDRPCRLLFVAHREEILKQSLYTFRAVLKDANFGELFVGNYKPESIDNLFLSIQTFNSQSFTEKTSPDFYDYIIVDEFHHAAAPTYQKLLSYYQPHILLGLTTTPERMDGKSRKSFLVKKRRHKKNKQSCKTFQHYLRPFTNLVTIWILSKAITKKPRSHPRKQLPIMKQRTAHFWMSRLESSLKLWKTVSPALFADLWNTLVPHQHAEQGHSLLFMLQLCEGLPRYLPHPPLHPCRCGGSGGGNGAKEACGIPRSR